MYINAHMSQRPRKSILKSFNSNFAAEETDDTVELSGQNYAHTIAFSTSGMSRRVSFAPNAHVRYVERLIECRLARASADSLQDV